MRIDTLKSTGTAVCFLSDLLHKKFHVSFNFCNLKFANFFYPIHSDRLGGDREIYEAIFNRFGSSINAIEVNRIDGIGADHWVTKMVRPHISHITKLTFDDCTLDEDNIFSPMMPEITHLAFRGSNINNFKEIWIETCNLDLFKCRKLERFDVRGLYARIVTVKEIIRNNPVLQSILTKYLNIKSFQENLTSNHLNQIKEVGEVKFGRIADIGADAMDRIVDTLRNLESLDLRFHPEIIGSLQRFGSECKQIRRLKLSLDYPFRWDDRVIAAVQSFQQIEYLNYDGAIYQMDKIESMIRCLPNLRYLHFGIWMAEFNFPFAYILPLLRECPSLQIINIALGDVYPSFVNSQFFKDFLAIRAITEEPNARIEIERLGKIVATIDGNGIVCGNKLVYWEGCDEIPESSNTHLLKLAEQLVKSDVEREQSRDSVQQHLLDRIFDYLDMASLYLFAATSPKSRQLVVNYIEMHSKQNGLFTFTDEFNTSTYIGEMHRIFAPHVTNIKIYNLNDFSARSMNNYLHLTKISIYDEHHNFNSFTKLPHHVIVDGPDFIDLNSLYHIVANCELKGAHSIELRNASSFHEQLSPRYKNLYGNFTNLKLKTFSFNYRGETQFNNLKKVFQGSQTKLIPIFPNSNH